MSNRDLPMMPWYPDQFQASTAAMSFAERSLYRALLDRQWQLGVLPADPKRLAICVGLSQAEFIEPWKGAVSAKFVPHKGGLINKRLESHRIAAQAYKEQHVSAGSRGGRASAAAKAKRVSSGAQAALLANAKPLSPSPSTSIKSSLPLERLAQGTESAAPIVPRRNGRQTAIEREQEPEAMRVAKALTVLKADPGCKVGDAARMFRVPVAAIEAAQKALMRAKQ